MSSRAWLDLPETVNVDGVVAETTLRAALWPRLIAATWTLLGRYPRGQVPEADRARWLAVCAAIDAGDAVTAVRELGALEAQAVGA